MKQKKCFYLALIANILLGALTLTSCKEDPVVKDDPNAAIVKKLTSHKWTGQETEYGETSIFTQTYVIYFIDDHQGICRYTTTDRDAYVGTDSRQENSSFTYTINDRHITVTPGFDGGFDFYDNFFTWSGTMFTPSELTESDREYIKWKDLEYNIRTRVKLVAYDEGYRMRFKFTSSLGEVYPDDAVDIEYGVDFLIADLYDTKTVYGKNKPTATYTVDAVIPEAQQIYSRVKELKQKSSLTVDERQYINDAVAALKTYTKETTYYPFVKVNGKKYSIDIYDTVNVGLTFDEDGKEDDDQDNNNEQSDEKYKNGILTVDGVQYKMISVSGGTFQMGATSEQGSDAYSDEKPVHNVTLNSFSIGQTEVTQALWKAVMGSNPSYNKGDNLPVEKVSWNDCQTFITKLNQLTGQKFRLPTEAEWEFAARGGRQSMGYKYSGSNTIGDVAWYNDNSSNKTHPVATKQANELGLYDMSGNVYEWCQDWYGSSYYSSSPSYNPTGPSSDSYRVIRGGGWSNSARYCRVSLRGNYWPSSADSRLGFRLAL